MLRKTLLCGVIALLLGPIGVSAQRRPYPPPPGAPANDPWMYNQNGPNNWDRSWNNRPYPRRGACFFTSARFQGNHFCVRGGDRLNRLPGNFGDNISSIQVFGGTRVQVFNDRSYRGGSQTFRSSIPDLRHARFRGGHTWNNRISSIAVF